MRSLFTLITLMVAMWANAELRVVNLDAESNFREMLGNDTLTVDSLRVKGYLSHANLVPISWMTNRSLEYLDLRECDIENNEIPYHGINPTPYEGFFEGNAVTKLKTILFPESLRILGPASMFCCRNLTTLKLPSRMDSIGRLALSHLMMYIREIKIPEGVKTLPTACLYDNIRMTRLSLPQSIEVIDTFACGELGTLEFISLPKGLKRIKKCGFAYTSNMRDPQNIIIPDSLIELGEDAFLDVVIINLVFPEDCRLKEISASAFENSMAENVVFSNGIEKIGNNAFENNHFTELFLPEKLEELDNKAFIASRKLKKVVFDKNIKSIGVSAFAENDVLSEVYVKAQIPPTIEASSFENRNEKSLFVPVGAKEAYSTAEYWKDFGEIIEVEQFPVAGREAVIAASGLNVRTFGIERAAVIEGDGIGYAVYSADGRKVAEGIANGRTEVPLPKGIYIVKADTVTRRIAVR